MYSASASAQQVFSNTSISKIHPTFFKLAIIFTSIGIVTAILLTLISSYSKNDYERYDYSRIEKEGTVVQGKIVTIKINYSTTINSRHPKTIRYTYTNNGKEVAAFFKTLSPGPVDQLKEGDSVEIKVLNNESKIANLEPFSFPLYIFYIIPAAFFLAGSGFFIALLLIRRKRSNSLATASAF